MFKLKISLGNDAMRTGVDIAAALRSVATRVANGARFGGILDVNGNKVGQFSVDEPLEEPEHAEA